MNERLKVGDIVRHFKWNTLPDGDKRRNIYKYKILAFATHTETKEKMVVYQALYSDSMMGINFDIFVRPYDMFMSEVDKNKYPELYTVQRYRFEK